MYKILTIEDRISVSPSKFGLKLENAVKSSLEGRWEGLVDKSMGVILSVVSVEDIGEGKIMPGDGAIHYPVSFSLLVYEPEMHEVIKGYVIEVTEFGAFIRLGPLDGMVHVSQIMDDFVSYDPKNMTFNGRESKRILKDGDIVKARIISVSISGKQYKIGLTTRQHGLGALEWSKLEKRRAEISRKSIPKPPGPKGDREMKKK